MSVVTKPRKTEPEDAGECAFLCIPDRGTLKWCSFSDRQHKLRTIRQRLIISYSKSTHRYVTKRNGGRGPEQVWGDLVHSRVEISISDEREKNSLLGLTEDARHMKRTHAVLHTDAHGTLTAGLTGTVDAYLMLRIRDC